MRKGRKYTVKERISDLLKWAVLIFVSVGVMTYWFKTFADAHLEMHNAQNK